MKQIHFLWLFVLISLILSGMAIARTFTDNLEFDYISLIFTATSIVVTALISAQIVQYFQIEKRMHEVAESEVTKSIGVLKEDLAVIERGSGYLFLARGYIVTDSVEDIIHNYMKTLKAYRSIKDSTLREFYSSTLLEEILRSVEERQAENQLTIYQEYRDSYLSLLHTFDSPLSVRLLEYLRKAETKTFSSL